MTVRPADVGTFGEALYAALTPYAFEDDKHDWALLVLLGCIGVQFQIVETYVRDNGSRPGWSIIVDVATAPVEALPWLAQIVGVSIPPGTNEAGMRAMIVDQAGWRRGSKPAMIGAGKTHLTGSKSLIFRERFGGSAYRLHIVTYTSETPTPAVTLADLVSQKPGGIVLTHAVLAGQDYQSLLTNHPTYANVFAAYATYYGIATDQPGS